MTLNLIIMTYDPVEILALNIKKACLFYSKKREQWNHIFQNYELFYKPRFEHGSVLINNEHAS